MERGKNGTAEAGEEREPGAAAAPPVPGSTQPVPGSARRDAPSPPPAALLQQRPLLAKAAGALRGREEQQVVQCRAGQRNVFPENSGWGQSPPLGVTYLRKVIDFTRRFSPAEHMNWLSAERGAPSQPPAGGRGERQVGEGKLAAVGVWEEAEQAAGIAWPGQSN